MSITLARIRRPCGGSRQRHFGEIGVRQHRPRVPELTQDLVERHAVFEPLGDVTAELDAQSAPVADRLRHVTRYRVDAGPLS